LTFDIQRIHLLNLLGDVRGVLYENQYNLKERLIKNKIVIDGGAHNGEFSLISAFLGAKKVYAFEPLSGTREILLKNISLNGLNKKIEVVPLALGNEIKKVPLFFNFLGDGSATIYDNSKRYSEEINVTKLDSFFKIKGIKRIDFIKLDVEGAEGETLMGAREVITQFKPVLSISAYHNPDDKIRIPKIIKSMRNDYKISLLKKDEEDFYCE